MTSIIVPVYNVEKTLKRCVDSLLSQSAADYEIILVNDGSTDSSLDILNEYALKDIRIRIIDKPNGDVSSARNAGIDAAQGEYIMFVDADDFVDKDYVAATLEAPKSDLVYSGVYSYNDTTQDVDGTIVEFEEMQIEPGVTDADRVIRNNILAVGYPYGKLFLRRLIQEHNIRFDTRIRNHEDHLFCLQYVSLCKSIALTKKKTYYWTYVKGSNSLSHRTPDYRQMIIASDGFLYYFEILFKMFCITDSAYIRKLTSEYGIGTRRAAVYCMYATEHDKKKRLAFIKEQSIVFRGGYLRYKYNPSQRKHLFVYLIMMMPITASIKDWMYCMIYRRR